MISQFYCFNEQWEAPWWVLDLKGIDGIVIIFRVMKEENCIEVKHVSRLSVAYLTRFFGSVGGVLKVQKDEISKYVTIVSILPFRNTSIIVVSRRPFGSAEGSLIPAPSKSKRTSK